METHKQVGAWLQNQMTFVASVITVTGFVGSLVSYGGLATIFLFMLGGGLALIAVRLSPKLIRPPESERFRAMRDEIVACRDLQALAELDPTDDEARREARTAFTELKMRLLSVRVASPRSADLTERRHWLDILSGLAADGQVKKARLAGRYLRGELELGEEEEP